MNEGGEAFTFQLEGAPVRGRYVRLGADVLDPILKRHDYPRAVALLLGEALALVGLMGALSKSAQVLTLQAEGDGPAGLLVAEWRAGGALRGYARVRDEARADLSDGRRRAPWELIGQGALALTIDQGPDMDQMQGIAPLEGATLAECAETYFHQSEQTPTRVKLTVAEDIGPNGAVWVAGGALIQRVAGDETRGFTEDDWDRAQILFATLSDAELADPALEAADALYRLFHEEGVRLSPAAALRDACTCDAGRLTAVLSRFTAEEVREFVEPDGLIHARCQFCARAYLLDPAALTP